MKQLFEIAIGTSFTFDYNHNEVYEKIAEEYIWQREKPRRNKRAKAEYETITEDACTVIRKAFKMDGQWYSVSQAQPEKANPYCGVNITTIQLQVSP